MHMRSLPPVLISNNAFEGAYSTLSADLLHSIKRRMRHQAINGVTPEDAAQITWTKMWSAYGPPPPNEPVEAYRRTLYTVARNTVQDLFRRNAARKESGLTTTVPAAFDREHDTDPAADPHGQLLARELAERVNLAIDTLPKYQADIIRARIHGAPTHEIAKHRRSTTVAVRHALLRARKAIQAHMNGEQPCDKP